MPEHTLDFASESAKNLAAVYSPPSGGWGAWTAAGSVLEPGLSRHYGPFPLIGAVVNVSVPTIPETITPGTVVSVAARFEGILVHQSGSSPGGEEVAPFAWTMDSNGAVGYWHSVFHWSGHYVRGAPCSQNYYVQCSGWINSGYGFAYPFTFLPDWDPTHTGWTPQGGDSAQALDKKQGTTVQIGLGVDPAFVSGWPFPNQPQAFTMDYLRAHFRFTYQTDDNGAPQTQGEPATVSDTYEPLAVTAFIHLNAKQEGASVRQVTINIHRGLLARAGSGSGSQNGWESYNWGDVDSRSRIGVFWRHDGALVLLFDEFPGGTRTARYSVNTHMGSGPRSRWSAPASITPNEARAMAVGRSQGQVYRFFS